MTVPRTLALIPAAGNSRRMGLPKLLLPLGDRTVLDRVVGAFRGAGVEQILVVVAPGAGKLGAVARGAGAQVHELAAETPDMRATVERGLDWMEQHWQPAPADALLVTPADHPTLDSAVISALLRARLTHPHLSVFLPVFAGRRGHPALLGWRHLAGIRESPAGEGLNTFLRRQAAETLELPIASPDVLCDLDTPEDYARLLRRPW